MLRVRCYAVNAVGIHIQCLCQNTLQLAVLRKDKAVFAVFKISPVELVALGCDGGAVSAGLLQQDVKLRLAQFVGIEQLIEQDGFYSQLYQSQFRRVGIAVVAGE